MEAIKNNAVKVKNFVFEIPNTLTQNKTKAVAVAIFTAVVAGASYLAYSGQLKPLASVAATKLSAFVTASVKIGGPLATAAIAHVTLPIALGLGAGAIVVILFVTCVMKGDSTTKPLDSSEVNRKKPELISDEGTSKDKITESGSENDDIVKID